MTGEGQDARIKIRSSSYVNIENSRSEAASGFINVFVFRFLFSGMIADVC